MPIYTRTGDNGTTQLYSAQRVSKASPIIELVGSLDELNSLLGICTSLLYEIEEYDFSTDAEVIESIQEDLFTVNSIIVGAKLEFDPKKETENIEKTIDDYEKLIPPLKHFILPGGSIASAHLHYARSQVRKVERLAVGLKSKSIQPFVPYLNRLSDLLFVMARYVNYKLDIDDVRWNSTKK